MNRRITKIEHKGKDIVLLDLSGMRSEEIVAIFPEFTEYVTREGCRRILIDISGTYTTEEIKAAGAASDAYVKERVGQTWKALVGVRGVQRLLANAIDRGQYFASSREDGLEHLAGIE